MSSGRRRNWEERHAAILIQARWRGNVERRVFWYHAEDNTRCGLGIVMMSVRIQKVVRGFLGRTYAAKKFRDKRIWAATRIQALYWGRRGRLIARRLRVRKYNAAAVRIQALGRGRMARCKYLLMLNARSHNCANLLQRIYLGHRGRKIARDERARQSAECSAMMTLWQDYVGSGEQEPTTLQEAHATAYSLLCGPAGCVPCVSWNLFKRLVVRYPLSASLRYGAWINAFVIFVYDASAARYGMECYSILEHGLLLLQQAWILDPERKEVDPVIRFCATARRTNAQPRSHLLLALAHTCFGNMGTDLRLLRTRRAYGKALWNLYQGQALSASDFERSRIEEATIIFTALFRAPAKVLKCQKRTFWVQVHDNDEEKTAIPSSITVLKRDNFLFISAKLQDVEPHERLVSLSEHALVIVHPSEVQEVSSLMVRQLIKEGKFVSERDTPSALATERFIATASLKLLTEECIDNSVYAVALPLVQSPRDEHAVYVQREWAALRLQRSYRGFEGKVRWYRLHEQLMQMRAQEMELERQEMEARRQWEAKYVAAQKIQALTRGFLQRTDIENLRRAAQALQRVFRRFRAKRLAEENERFRLEGARVETVFCRGAFIGGCSTLLTVMRSGLSFKFVAVDPLTCHTHVGYCYEKDVLLTVSQHNQKLRWVKDHIRLHQHEEIANLLAQRLKVVNIGMAACPTYEMRIMRADGTALIVAEDGASHRDNRMELQKPGILERRGSSRPLADMGGALSSYGSFQKKEAEQRREWQRIRARQHHSSPKALVVA